MIFTNTGLTEPIYCPRTTVVSQVDSIIQRGTSSTPQEEEEDNFLRADRQTNQRTHKHCSEMKPKQKKHFYGGGGLLNFLLKTTTYKRCVIVVEIYHV